MQGAPPVPVIAALQLPPFGSGERRPIAWYEDFLLSNARIFFEGGIRAVKVQDETCEKLAAAPRTVARMAALGRAFRKEFPDMKLGIIVQAHDAISPLAIADAADAHFVRLKIFVGAAVNAAGTHNALSAEAMRYRSDIARPDISIYADVHDHTSMPLAPVAHEKAALWAQSMGADGIIITGSNFDDTIARVGAARAAGVKRPILIGAGVTADNVATALDAADAVVVSTSLRRDGAAYDDFNLWDKNKVLRLMEAAQRN
jgi:predicted TIM-barrel enzyme